MLEVLTSLHPRTILVALAVWLATTVGTALVGVVVILRLPPGHFVARHRTHAPLRGAGGWLRRIVRNLAGLALILLGAVLSLPGVPGQGVLTMLVGVMLLDVPGRRRLERWLVARRGVLTALNRLRARFGKPPLLPPAG